MASLQPADAEPPCAVCGEEVEPLQAYISAECTSCGRLNLHSWCATKYINSRIRTMMTNTKAVEKSKLTAKAKPWRQLDHMRCPLGWREDAEQQQQQPNGKQKQWGWEGRHRCNGRIHSPQLVDTPREKKEKKKKAKAAAGAIPSKQVSAQQQKLVLSRPTSAGIAQAAHAGPAVAPMSLAKAQEFLGIVPEEEEGSEVEDEDGFTSGEDEQEDDDWEEDEEWVDEEVEAEESGYCGDGGSTAAPGGRDVETEDVIEGGEPHLGGTATDAGEAVQPQQVDNPSAMVLTREEAEVAVREGLLPADYRTRLCPKYVSGMACLSPVCPHAHSLKQLRVDAAIQEGLLPQQYKTVLCSSYVNTGNCYYGRACCSAHSIQEVRALASIRSGIVPPTYKTQRCTAYTAGGACPYGLVCGYAHGNIELRREAAVQLGLLPPLYKTAPCIGHYTSGVCPVGDACFYAHGVTDIRLHAAIRDRILPPNYKTQLCDTFQRTGFCPIDRRCSFAHGEGELLPHLVMKGTLCAIWLETGRCRDDCPFAHGSEFLRLPVEGIRQKLAAAHAAASAGAPLSAAVLNAAENGGSSGDSGTHSSAAVEHQVGAAGSGSQAGSSATVTAAMRSSARDREWGFAAGTASESIAAPAASVGASSHTADIPAGAATARSSSAPSEAGSRDASLSSSIRSGAQQGRQQQQRQRQQRQSTLQAQHEGQLQALLGSRGRPQSLKPCIDFADCGQCWTVSCPYAHGPKELRQREKSWIEQKLQQREQRKLQQLHKLRKQVDQEVRELQLLAQHGQLNSGSSSTQHVGEPHQYQHQNQPQQQHQPAEQQLSEAALEQMREHKLQLCAMALTEAGFDPQQARVAAEAAGAAVERAFELVLEGGGSSGTTLPINVSREAEEVVQQARQLGLPVQAASQELLMAAGNWEEAKQQLAIRAAASNGGHPTSTSGQAAAQLALPLPLPLPVRLGASAASAAGTAAACVPQAEYATAGWGEEDWGVAQAGNTTGTASAGGMGGGIAAWSAQAAAGAAVPPQAALSEEAVQLAEQQYIEQSFESFVDVIKDAWQQGEAPQAQQLVQVSAQQQDQVAVSGSDQKLAAPGWQEVEQQQQAEEQQQPSQQQQQVASVDTQPNEAAIHAAGEEAAGSAAASVEAAATAATAAAAGTPAANSVSGSHCSSDEGAALECVAEVRLDPAVTAGFQSAAQPPMTPEEQEAGAPHAAAPGVAAAAGSEPSVAAKATEAVPTDAAAQLLAADMLQAASTPRPGTSEVAAAALLPAAVRGARESKPLTVAAAPAVAAPEAFLTVAQPAQVAAAGGTADKLARHKQQEAEEEVEELLSMLGIAS